MAGGSVQTLLVSAPAPAGAPVRQYSRAGVAAVWAAAALPMALLAWVVAPVVASATHQRLPVPLIVALIAGLVWQFVLVLILVGREQHSLGWAVLRRALWLEAPTRPTGQRGGRLWLWVIPFILGFAVLQFLPAGLTGPASRNLGKFLGSAAGKATFHGAWGLFAVVAVLLVFNTVLGEELLFRGFLLPRMRGAFGRADWIVNGVLFGLYHLHEPWTIPQNVVAGVFLFAFPARRFHSAWLGIAIHSAQTVVFLVLVLGVVLS
jgi:membrane protease YdiL (CAAX protease family)